VGHVTVRLNSIESSCGLEGAWGLNMIENHIESRKIPHLLGFFLFLGLFVEFTGL
jgi:hypothetical protein